ncbi:MAG: lipopolysaccharide kinase InaA family protein [Flavobacterium sp.]
MNQVVYKFFRKSKAWRSYEFANRLLECEIGTPQPIAFSESFSLIGIKTSFYISEHLAADLTFRELVEIPDYPEHAIILQQFMHFCFELHEKGIEFLDHSPGNTLIVKTSPGQYRFYLVDLNRMQFHTHMPFEMRMKNLSRLTPKKEMVEQMGAFYAEKYLEKSTVEIVERLWFYTQEFQEAFARKIRVKQQIKFWK